MIKSEPVDVDDDDVTPIVSSPAVQAVPPPYVPPPEVKIEPGTVNIKTEIKAEPVDVDLMEAASKMSQLMSPNGSGVIEPVVVSGDSRFCLFTF